jgi:hypothetical protein
MIDEVDILTPEDWLLSALLNMVIGHCQTPENKLDSFDGWPAHRNAMRLLAEAGLIEIKSDLEERILAEAAPAANALTARIEAARRRETNAGRGGGSDANAPIPGAASDSAGIEINGMEHADFQIGMEFFTAAGRWRVTDIGARTIVAIKLDQTDPRNYNGPPYSIVESVFDEYDLPGCEPCVARFLSPSRPTTQSSGSSEA